MQRFQNMGPHEQTQDQSMDTSFEEQTINTAEYNAAQQQQEEEELIVASKLQQAAANGAAATTKDGTG